MQRTSAMLIEKQASKNEKAVSDFSLTAFGTTGRDGGIRTRDPLHPMQVRYQAALRPEQKRNIT